MKKLIIFALAVNATACNVHAVTNEEMCTAYAESAKLVMTARQNNVPLSALLASLNQYESHKAIPYIKEIAIGAYNQPAFTIEKYKQTFITEYANKVLVDCLGTLKGD